MSKFNFFSIAFLTTIIASFLIHSEIAAQPWLESAGKNANFFEIQKSFNQYWEGKERVKGSGYKVFRRWEEYWRYRVNPDGTFPLSGVVLTGLEEHSQLVNASASRGGAMAAWTAMGPNTSAGGYSGLGRINAIAFHPTNSDIIWAGSPGGGLWKSTNGGATWNTGYDNFAVLGVSSILVTPSNPNIMYVATGDGDAGNTRSIGVYKSTDGGATWAATGLTFTLASYKLIRKLLMDPNDESHILAATSDGLYRTTNSGTTWTKVVNANFYDVEAQPGTSSNNFYASTYGGLYRSTDNGATWTLVQIITGSGRIAIGVSAADPATVVALCSKSSNGSFLGFYRSTNNGSSYSLQSSAPNLLGWSATGSGTGGQGSYDLVVTIDPTDANTVYIGGINIWKSTDAGVTWSLKGHWLGENGAQAVHADQHAFEWQNNTTLFNGNDGGIYKTVNGGTNWTDITNGMQISQMYRLGVSQTTNSVVTGLQDNGSKLRSSDGIWTDVLGGDGMECAIDYSNAQCMYYTFQEGVLVKSSDGGLTAVEITPFGLGATGAWVTPYIISSHDPATLFIGYNDVYKSTDRGNSWTQISTNLSISKDLTVLADASSDANVIYAGTDDALYRTINGGTDWATMTIPAGAGLLRYLCVNPTDANTIYATMSNYTAGSKVYKSTNGGLTWTNISGILPNLPANCVIYQKGSPEGLYVGMDAGVYYRDNITNEWALVGTGLPNVVVNELEIKYDTGKLRAATFGRGLWESDINCVSPTILGPIVLQPNCTTNTDGRIWIVAVGSGILEYSVNGGTNWQLDNLFFNLAPGNYDIMVRLKDSPTCVATWSSNPEVIISPYPTASAVTGGGSYCSGGAGVPAGLSSTQTGVNYQLRLNDSNIGNSVSGTGSAITFGNQTAAGTYTVIGTNTSTGCTATMTGSVTVTVNSLPMAAIEISETSGLNNNDGYICDGASVTLSASGGDSYAWSSGLGTNNLVTLTPVTSVYTNRTNWLSAVNGTPSQDNYTDAPPGSIGSPYYRTGYSLSASGDIFINSVEATAPEVSTVTPNTPIVITFSSPQTAVGLKAWVSNFQENYESGTITVTAGSVNQQLTVSSPTFFGFISSTPFTTLTINHVSVGGLYTTMDDLEFAAPAASPYKHNYSVTLTNANGCTATASATLTSPPALAATVASQTNVSCSGGANGSVTVSASGGVPGYTYSWNTTPVQSTSSATGLSAGTYTVTVTDANGCTATASATLTSPPALAATVASQTNITCYGGANGSVTVLASGGVPGYTYSWNTTPVQSTSSATGLSAGTYTVTVTDANGCTATASATLTSPPALAATVTSQTNITCYGGANGSVTVLASGGVPGYTYSWNTTPVQSTSSATGLSAGTYTVTVRDAYFCVATASATLTSPPALVATVASQTNVSCHGGANGSVTVLASGGVPGYTYSWNTTPVQSTSSATGLSAGTYTVTVRDAYFCVATASATLTSPPALAATVASQTNITCSGGANGSVTVLASGGVPGYTYSWNTTPVQSTSSATGLSAGTYTVTVTDANGCTATASATLTSPPALAATVASQTNVSCYGGANGSVTVLASGGVPGYTYSWNTTPVQSTSTATGLSAGTYTVTVRDAYFCEATASATLTSPPALVATVASQTNVSCHGGANGSVTVLASGGVPGYTYSWNTTPVQSTSSATGLSAGTYTVTVRDAYFCEATASATLTSPPALVATVASQTNVSCSGGANGSVTVSASGGVPGYTYSWNTTPVQSTSSATGLSAGTYTVTVTDANGCVATASATLTSPPAIAATVASQTNITCYGGANGSVTVLASGGVPGYTYSWNTTPVQSTSSATGLSAGTYTVTVTDANGCVATASATLTSPPALAATVASQTNITCSGGANGSVTVLASGGVPGYTYSWNTTPVQSTSSATGLSAGTYTVTVTDANGCVATASATLTSPPAIAATVASQTNVSCYGGANGIVTVAASGGVPGYTYSWNTTPVQSTSIATGLSAGTYTVTVTDANGCTATASTTLTSPTALAAVIYKTDVLCYGGSNGTVTVSESGGVPGYTYAWNTTPVQNTMLATVSAGTYTVTVTDANGCTATASATPASPPALAATVASQTNISCYGGANGSVTVLASGGVSGYTYSWNTTPVQSTSSATGLSAGTYTVTVTDANMCILTQNTTLTEPALLEAGLVALPTCSGQSIGAVNLSMSGGVPGYLFSWNNGSMTEDLSGLAAGTYTVTVTDINGCTVTGSSLVNTSTPAPPVISALETSANITNDGVICKGSVAQLSVAGGSNFLWSDGSTGATLSVSPNCTNSYGVSITDMSGCQTSGSYTVIVRGVPNITGISPLSGSLGDMITINGINFDGLTGVMFNGASVEYFNIVNANQLTASLPFGGSLQQVELLSVCGNITMPISTPTIASFTPATGQPGTMITLTGTNLDQLVSASAGGKSAIILSKDATSARILVMPGAATGSVSVTNPVATATAPSSFTVNSTTPHPYIQQGAKLTNSSTNATQGSYVSVSADGNTAIIGSPGDDGNKGAAWIYVRSGTSWSQQAKLVGTGTTGSAKQGMSVAISADGNTAAVGGLADNSNAGAIWIFKRSGNTWSQQGSKLVGTGAIGTAQQGASVAVSGDGNTVASGGVADDGYKGAAWVFARYGNTWAQVGEKITGNDYTGAARQGASLALNGNGSRLLMGGYQDNNRQGAVWAFGTDGCVWTQLGPKLVGTGGTSQAWQGYSVSLSTDGNTAVVGGNSDNNLKGSAWVYTYAGNAWTQVARLVGTQAAGAAKQGNSVSLSADGRVIIVGGSGDDSNKGAVWVYKKTGAVWVQQGAKIKGNNAVGSAKQGTSVSLSSNGTTAVIGGPADNTNKGAFWVYVPATTIPSMQQVLLEERTEVSAGLRLDQNIPNPFTGSTTISFSVPEACVAEWEITDVSGRVIQLLRRAYAGGEHTERFDLSAHSGVFYYRLKTPFGTAVKKMLIVK